MLYYDWLPSSNVANYDSTRTYCIQIGRTISRNIIDEGLMRNGVHDSNSRGVWFYLGFQHPWAASEEEILVELEVVQSTTHKKSKWHYKYCAADSPPGEPNRWTRVRALHVPVCLLTDEFIRELRG